MKYDLLTVNYQLCSVNLEDHLRANENEGISFEHHNGTTLDLIKLFVLLYADDTVILGETAEDLQNSIDSFLKYWKLKVNESKTKVVIFGARKTDSFSFHLGNTPLEVVDNYRYLGTYFSKTRSFLKARKYIAEQAKKEQRKLCIYCKLELRIYFFQLTFNLSYLTKQYYLF